MAPLFSVVENRYDPSMSALISFKTIGVAERPGITGVSSYAEASAHMPPSSAPARAIARTGWRANDSMPALGADFRAIASLRSLAEARPSSVNRARFVRED